MNRRDQRQKPHPRSPLARDAHLRSGAGVHRDSRREAREPRSASNRRAIRDSF